MLDKDSATPRVYLIRHGATAWSQSGKFTSLTDLPLLPIGEQRMRETARHVFGAGLLIDPANLARVYVSPRQRSRKTLEILLESAAEEEKKKGEKTTSAPVDVRVTEDVTEWGYGEYEGLFTNEIRALRKKKGLDIEREWDIWKDGTEGKGGEMPSDVQIRVDRVIGEVVALQGKYLRDAKEGILEAGRRRDVLIVAHGHILRAFVKRWLGLHMATGIEMMLDPGGVCGLSYAHGRVEERAVLVGMSFPGSK